MNLALEPRTLTRWDAHKYARQAYDMGVRFIGGCCGFEPYHIRAIAEEVREFFNDIFRNSKRHQKMLLKAMSTILPRLARASCKGYITYGDVI